MVKFTLCIFVSFVLGMLCISCDDDCPVCPACPDPEPEPVSDYNVYLAGYPHSIYVYNTREMVLVDSLDPVDVSSLNNFVVSPDGSHLLLSYGFPAEGVLVYNLETGDTVKTLPAGVNMEVSYTGRYIAHSVADGTDFLDGETFETLFTLPIPFGCGRFSLDDTKFYMLVDNHYVHIYDLATQSLDTSFMFVDNDGNSPSIYRMQQDATGNKFYFAVGYEPYIYYILAYSLEVDSTTMFYRLIGPPYGDMSITPDGSQILYSDPGDVFFEMQSSNCIFFFDPDTDAFISVVNAGHSIEGDGPPGFTPSTLAITPDSRYTIAACSYGCPAFGMIDNFQHRFVNVTYEKSQPYLWHFWLARCQTL